MEASAKREHALHPEGHYHCVITKVVEKTALFTCCVLEDSIESLSSRGFLDGVTKIVLWSDCGGHYRNKTLLACCNHHWIRRFSKDFVIKFGLEHHMKSWMDKFFWSPRRSAPRCREETTHW